MSPTPVVSARVAANRRNAARSTGPKTPEGKVRARANAIKHGLTGAGVALPGEDQAAIEAEFLQAQEDFAPTTALGMKLVRRAALLGVRLDRCERHANAVAARRDRHAAANLQRVRAEHVERMLDAIETNPRPYRRALLNSPEGVDRLTAELSMLIEELVGPTLNWTNAHHTRLDALFGYRVTDIPFGRPTQFSRALLGDWATIGEEEVGDTPDEERPDWALTRLLEAIDAELEALAKHRATLDHDALAADQSAAVDLAPIEVDRAAELARRYEAATARELSRTIRDIHLVEAMAAEEPDEVAEPDPSADPEPSAVVPEPSRNSFSENEISPTASFGATLPASQPAAAEAVVEPATGPAAAGSGDPETAPGGEGGPTPPPAAG